MSVINAVPLLAAAGGDYQISRSVRLRSSASAYFNRTPAGAGNRKTWTWSAWVKRGTLGAAQVLFCSDVGTSNSTWLELGFDAGDTITIQGYTTDSNTTAAVFRDPSAWYHIVVAFDSTQATSANRCKIYVNGTQQTLTGAGFTLNADYGINNAQAHGIGYRNWASGVGRYLDGYLTEVNFIDGQALTPSSFGETDAVTGVWKPKKYAGTYGTNGFYLNFSDTSSFGKDSSGNNNTWTSNNISVTAGVTYDSMIDVPTLGASSSNYCVLNPLDVPTTGSPATISNGNLACVTPSSGYGFTSGSFAPSSGKWYWEYIASAGSNFSLGFGLTTCARTYAGDTGSYMYYNQDGKTYANAGAGVTYGATWTTGDVIAVALDLDAGTATFYKNNVSQGTAFTGLSGTFMPVFSDQSPSASNTFTVNFGQQPFTYTPPTGFKALNTFNLPDSTITKGSKQFNTVTYTGNGSAQTVTGFGFDPDFVWHKGRSVAYSHSFVDRVRGNSNVLFSNTTDAEANPGAQLDLATDGATVTYRAANLANNQSSATYVIWGWKAGGTAVSNTAGSITSQVSANTSAGFSIVTYTGTGANATVGHGLGVAPKMVIVKNRDLTNVWMVYHSVLGGTQFIILNRTDAAASLSTVWNNTNPTSSVFSIGTVQDTNNSGSKYVAYCFSEVAGFSKFGSYTGNGSTDGPFVYCGFRPRFILTKPSSSTGSWLIHDTARDTYNVSDLELQADTSLAEYNTNGAGAGDRFDILSNGFKNRSSNAGANSSGVTYIFAAFAENPFKNALAR